MKSEKSENLQSSCSCFPFFIFHYSFFIALLVFDYISINFYNSAFAEHGRQSVNPDRKLARQ